MSKLQAHIVLTFPHCLYADEVYLHSVEGLKPDPEIHQTFAVLETNTGIPIHGGKKVQFNMFIRKINSIKPTDNLEPALFPIIWVHEGVKLPEKYVKQMKDELMYPLYVMEVVKWCLIAVGGVLFFVFLFIFLYIKRQTTTV